LLTSQNSCQQFVELLGGVQIDHHGGQQRGIEVWRVAVEILSAGTGQFGAGAGRHLLILPRHSKDRQKNAASQSVAHRVPLVAATTKQPANRRKFVATVSSRRKKRRQFRHGSRHHFTKYFDDGFVLTPRGFRRTIWMLREKIAIAAVTSKAPNAR
jgi:hypothetical protein